MEKHPEINGLRTWIEIDRTAVAHNYKILRGLLSPKTKFMAVVKSNAYGHSLVDFSKEMAVLGVDWIGVDSIVEATSLRKAGIILPIFVLGYTLPERLEEASSEHISLSVSTFETLEALSKIKGDLSIHIKVDTGMHRQGFQTDDLERVISKLISLPKNITIEGLFTHFGAAKNPSMPSKTLVQIESFEVWIKAFRENNFTPIIHAAASGGALIFPQSHFDLVRLGISTYGIWPSAQAKGFGEKDVPLQPVLSWKTIIGEVKDVKMGESVGYDFTEILTRDSRLAVCPVGYWHGLPRAVSSVGHLLVHGQRARIVGRVSMDMVVIDVTNIFKAKVGDVVTIIGRDGKEEVSAEEIAILSDTSAYEILTRINPLIKRVFV